MVHALKEIWRVLSPGGQLIDLRPRPANWPLEIVANGQISPAGRLDNMPFLADDRAAEESMQGMVRDRWFAPDQHRSFECATYWNTLDDMLTYYAVSPRPPLTVPNDVLATAQALESAASQGSRVCIRYGLALSTYRKILSD